MSGVLKTIGKVAGFVAAGVLIATQLGAPAGFALLGASLGSIGGVAGIVAAVATVGSSLLAPKAKAPATSASTVNRLQASIDPRAFRTIALGSTALSTDIRDQEYTGTNQEYLHRFIVTGSHEIGGYDEIWFDDKKAWTAAGGVQGEFVGHLTVATRTVGNAGNAINISARMGTTRRYTGLAYIHFRYKLTGNSENVQSPFAQSVPTRVTIRGRGALIYDPRLDSTRGGSGAHRADNQTTWQWDADASRNPALALLWYLLGWRIQNPVTSEWKLAVGKGIPVDRIDIASFITAANICDEPVARAAGGTEPRYRCDGTFSEGDNPSTVLESLKAAMNADLDDVDGQLRLTVFTNDLATPIADFTEDDIIGAFSWDPATNLADSFNVVRGSYTDPSDASLYQQVDLPEIRLASPDGIDRIQTIPLPLVQSPSQCARLLKQRAQRQIYSGMFRAEFQATGWRVQKNDVVRLSFSPLGWSNVLFRVVEGTARVDGVVPLTLRIENAAIYAWDASDAAPVTALDPTTFDPANNPIIQAVTALFNAVDAAGELAAGKSTIFYQSTPPTAAESALNDRWVNTAQGNMEYRRIAGSGRLAIGGDAITIGGNYITLPPWAPAPDSRISQALIEAAGAQATADRKVATFSQEAQPTAEGIGDLWFQPSAGSLKRWSGAIWLEVSTIGATAAQIALIGDALTDAANAQATADGKIDTFYQTGAPTGAEGDLWFDTDDGNKQYRLTSGVWTVVQDSEIGEAITAAAGAQSTADGKVTTFVGESPPTPEGEGDLWFKPSTGFLSRWSGSAWLDVSNIGATPAQIGLINDALTDAANAQATADGKIVTFFQTTMPSGSEGDLWFDTDDGNKQYRHNGTTFVAVQDEAIGDAIAAAAGAQATADGKITTFIAASAPTAEGVGDLWYDTVAGILKRWNGSTWVATSDQTASNTPTVTGAATIAIAADYLSVTTTVLPIPRRLIAMIGTTDVSSTTSFVVGTLPGGIAATINNTGGSADRGVLSLTQADASGSIPVTVTFANGYSTTVLFTVTRTKADPPSSGGSGATTVTDSISQPGSTSHAFLTGELTVRSTAGGTLRFSASADYSNYGAGLANMAIKPAYKLVGAGSYTDAQTETTGVGAVNGVDGYVSITEFQVSGLTASTDYSVVLYGRRTSANSPYVNFGSFTVRQ